MEMAEKQWDCADAKHLEIGTVLSKRIVGGNKFKILETVSQTVKE